MTQFYRPSREYVQQARRRYRKAFMPWTPEEDEDLQVAAKKGLTLSELVKQLERSPRSILMRLELYGLTLKLSEPPKETVVADPTKEWPKEAVVGAVDKPIVAQ